MALLLFQPMRREGVMKGLIARKVSFCTVIENMTSHAICEGELNVTQYNFLIDGCIHSNASKSLSHIKNSTVCFL